MNTGIRYQFNSRQTNQNLRTHRDTYIVRYPDGTITSMTREVPMRNRNRRKS